MAKITTKANIEPKTTKSPRTIKVSTVVWSIALLLALIGGFIGGIATRSAYADAVNKEASSQVKEVVEQLKNSEQ